MRLINADKLYEDIANKLTWLMRYNDRTYLDVGDDIRDVFDKQPTYDIVLCNECKNYSENIVWETESRPQYFCVKNNHYCKDDWYCADGEYKQKGDKK